MEFICGIEGCEHLADHGPTMHVLVHVEAYGMVQADLHVCRTHRDVITLPYRMEMVTDQS